MNVCSGELAAGLTRTVIQMRLEQKINCQSILTGSSVSQYSYYNSLLRPESHQSRHPSHWTQWSRASQLARQEVGLQTREGQHPLRGGGEGQGDHREAVGSVLSCGPSLSALPAPLNQRLCEAAINLPSGQKYTFESISKIKRKNLQLRILLNV